MRSHVHSGNQQNRRKIFSRKREQFKHGQQTDQMSSAQGTEQTRLGLNTAKDSCTQTTKKNRHTS